MADNQRAKHGQPNQPGGQGNHKSPPEQGKAGKEEGNQDSRFGQGGKGDQKQDNLHSQKRQGGNR